MKLPHKPTPGRKFIVLAAAFPAVVAANSYETIEVLGKSYRNTATKTMLTAEETPQAISILEQEALEQRDPTSVAQALRYVPGVHTELRGNSATGLDHFNIRGFTNFQIFYDGLPLMYNQSFLQPQVDPIALEQLEVFKGPTSILYGSIPPGGMVNLIAKSPQQTQSTKLSLSGGTANFKEFTMDSTGQIGESDFSYRLLALARKKDGQVATTKEERYVLAPSLDWQVSERTLVNFNLYYQNDPSLVGLGAVPASGSVKSNPHGKLKSNAFMGDVNWNEFKKDITLVGYKINHEFNNNWVFLQNARYMDGQAAQKLVYGAALAPDQRTLARSAFATDEKSRSFAIDNQLSGAFQTGDLQHNLLIGVDYQQLTSDILLKSAASGVSSIDIFMPDNNQANLGSLEFAYVRDTELKTRQIGLYLQDQVRFDNLVLIAGVRYDKYKQNQRQTVSGNTTETTLDQSNTAMRFGALYEFDNGISPYASFAQSFEPVPGKDRHGNDFEPSTGEQWETGIKYASSDMSTQVNLSAFVITKKNDLTRDPAGTSYDKVQTGETQSKGLELETQWQITDPLHIAASYTYLDMEVTKDNSGLQGKTPSWVPESSANAWLNYEIDAGLMSGATFGAGVRYVGEAQLNPLNTEQVPDYTLVDLSIGYDLGQLSHSLTDFSANLVANNLLDTEYFSCYDEINCWFGQEQSVKLKINYEL